MPKVSVIVPVYKVEAFIGRCAEALMEQTLQDAEFIFVDDASPDGSMRMLQQVLDRYPHRQVKICRHAENRGLPAARNTGLKEATGEYVWHCDSDDYPEVTFLEKMYNAAVAAHADMAYCDFSLDYGDRRRYMGNPDYTEAGTMLREGFLAGRMKYNVWNKLIRRSLYDGVSFPEGHSMGEDMTVILLAAKAATVVHVPEALYAYVKLNENAYSNTFSERHQADIKYNVERVLSALQDVPENFQAFFLLNTKLPFLFSGSHAQYRLWREWFPESNAFIDANRYQPRRTRLVQSWAAKGWWPLVWCYAMAVNKLYYGLLLRLKR